MRKLFISTSVYKTILITVLALASAPLLVGVAHSADGKVYAGIECFRDVPKDIRVSRRFVGSVFNNINPSSRLIHCPAIHDGRGIRRVWVKVTDGNPETNVRCKLHAKYFSNSGQILGEESISRESSDSGTQVQTLNFRALPAHKLATYVLLCELPGRDTADSSISYLHSYGVIER